MENDVLNEGIIPNWMKVLFAGIAAFAGKEIYNAWTNNGIKGLEKFISQSVPSAIKTGTGGSKYASSPDGIAKIEKLTLSKLAEDKETYSEKLAKYSSGKLTPLDKDTIRRDIDNFTKKYGENLIDLYKKVIENYDTAIKDAENKIVERLSKRSKPDVISKFKLKINNLWDGVKKDVMVEVDKSIKRIKESEEYQEDYEILSQLSDLVDYKNEKTGLAKNPLTITDIMVTEEFVKVLGTINIKTVQKITTYVEVYTYSTNYINEGKEKSMYKTVADNEDLSQLAFDLKKLNNANKDIFSIDARVISKKFSSESRDATLLKYIMENKVDGGKIALACVSLTDNGYINNFVLYDINSGKLKNIEITDND